MQKQSSGIPSVALLQTESGLLTRLVDEYVSYYQYTEALEKARLPHESRVFHPTHKQKINKSDMTPLIMESTNLAVFRGKKWQADLMFDPVMGTYSLKYKGDGRQAHDTFLSLVGVDDSEWSGGLCRFLVGAAISDWEKYEPYRKIAGVNYRNSDRNRREGPKDVSRGQGKIVRTEW